MYLLKKLRKMRSILSKNVLDRRSGLTGNQEDQYSIQTGDSHYLQLPSIWFFLNQGARKKNGELQLRSYGRYERNKEDPKFSCTDIFNFVFFFFTYIHFLWLSIQESRSNMENLQMYVVWRESLNKIKCISIILRLFTVVPSW